MPEDVTFCGVFDGHGPHGHLVARKVRDLLPLKIMSSLHSCESKQSASSTACCAGNLKSDVGDAEKDGDPEEKVGSLWREAFLKSYKAMDKELKSCPNLDCFCSGSTAITIVKQVRHLGSTTYPILFPVFMLHHLISFHHVLIARVLIFTWEVLGIPEQSWDPRTVMTPWLRFS